MNLKTLSLLLALFIAAACSDDSGGPAPFIIEEGADVGTTSADAGQEPDAAPDAGPLTGISVEVLGEGEETFDNRVHAYQLLRITDHDTGTVTYAQWSEPDGGIDDSNPVMVATVPYAGIDWTGEEVDERWAAKGDGLHPDEDSPEFDPRTSSNIAYSLLTPRAGVDRGMLFLVNGISTLLVYGRFYAGGGIQNEVDDMVAGLKYLAQRGDVDPDRIGINGGSWGGFEALYAAANAPDAARPSVGLALYPLSDFELEWAWSEQLAALPVMLAANRYRAFFDPYRRRIAETTGGSPDDPGADFSSFNHGFLGNSLETEFIMVHDEHDVLVPFTQAEALRDTLGADARYLWFRQESPVEPASAPLGHGQTVGTHAVAIFTLVLTPLITSLADPEAPFVATVANRTGFEAMLAHFEVQASRGQSLYDLHSLLIDLADPRVQVLELESTTFVPGNQFVAETYNAAFGTTYTADDVVAGLSAE